MKTYDIEAINVEIAKFIAYERYGAIVIADQTVGWGHCKFTDDVNEYAFDYMLNNELFAELNAAIIINIKKNRRTRIYRSFKPKKRKGKCKLTRTIEIRSAKTHEVFGIAKTKTEAIKLAKELIYKHPETLYGKTIYVSNDIDFTLQYRKENASLYRVFIVEEEDVRLYKRRQRGIE